MALSHLRILQGKGLGRSHSRVICPATTVSAPVVILSLQADFSARSPSLSYVVVVLVSCFFFLRGRLFMYRCCFLVYYVFGLSCAVVILILALTRSYFTVLTEFLFIFCHLCIPVLSRLLHLFYVALAPSSKQIHG